MINNLKMTNKDSVCTIIIPTFNRPKELKRVLKYYDSYSVPYPIIIGDASVDEIKKKNKETIAAVKTLNIKYLNDYLPDKNPMIKINDLILNVNTKYCVFCADDDLIVPNAIDKAIDFLEKNIDYISVGGRHINFWVEKNKNNKNVFKWTHIYQNTSINKSIKFPNPISRFIFHFAAYIPTFYYVTRTKYLKLFYEDVMKLELELIFTELLPSLLTVIHGKIKYLNTLYGARDAHQYIEKNRTSYLDYIRNGTYSKLYLSFREKILPHLTKMTKINREKAEILIDNAMILHRKFYFQKTILNSGYNLRFILHFYKTYSKIFVVDLILLLFRILFINRYMYLKILFRKKYNKSSSKNYEDFKKIKTIVLKYTKPYE